MARGLGRADGPELVSSILRRIALTSQLLDSVTEAIRSAVFPPLELEVRCAPDRDRDERFAV